MLKEQDRLAQLDPGLVHVEVQRTLEAGRKVIGHTEKRC
jgi:hypothetical protein